MLNDKESPFTLTLLEDDLSFQVVQFSGHEALNQPYRFEVEVIGLPPAMPFDQLLQQPSFLSLGHGQGFHGILHSASHEYRGAQRVGYKMVMVPYLQALDRNSRRRVFHDLSVPMILRQLLEDHDLPAGSYRFELANGHYPLRPFCIQYEESDLALLQRLCEEEGIHYHFDHHRDGHVLVLADDSLSFPQEPLLTPFQADAPLDNTRPAISELFQRHDALPSHPRRDASNRGAQNAGDGAANHALGKTAPGMARPDPGQEQRSRRQLQRLRCLQQQVHGQSNHGAMRSARIVQVTAHPLSCFNDQWLLTETRHQGRQPSTPARDSSALMYRNRFSAIPWSTEFRPALKQARPSIPGYQPARVLGQLGQPPELDDRGRMQVRLWPTTHADPDESGGLWLPLAVTTPEGWIDPGRLPKAGSEVLISFLDSDPDRPVLCVGLGQIHTPEPARPREPRSDTRLLLDWLLNRSDLTP
ncbi:Actin cross-linking toxin VgrG1 [Pseudomonas fluorescens]|uniref:Actin cross-linking toxin VgrG1 n=1 Tax=Pseudomonas fluorescens TaxID=294 RepID=A0A5E6UZT2_PSEFL|nr:type VI secretion system tip protein TssI/VgrG [Pseudomonas fluorescens]VVN06006.1 Actin cross-linking toxin VgrG1 [Pseudomonas fluorescens]VVO63592.1 Actin cross-linking toxin VgrG1 [Pseudomonas fluorescens]